MKYAKVVLHSPNVGVRYRLRAQLGPMMPGETVICFAQTSEYMWLLIPRPWFGTVQIKLHNSLSTILEAF